MKTKEHSAQWELTRLNLGDTIEDMTAYATRRLRHIEPKQLEGITPDDVVQNILLKILEGVRNWQVAKTDNFRDFLFGCLRSEISNIAKKMKRRDVGLFPIRERYDQVDIIEDSSTYEDGFKERQHEFVPKSYNNEDDQETYYTEKL